MQKLHDLTGKKFGRLTVLNRSENKGIKTMWNCRCDCGTEKQVWSISLIKEHTRSCGCFQKEIASNTGKINGKISRKGINKTHGEKHTRLYVIWCNMKSRCDNINNHTYKYYGGENIKYCNDWSEFIKFKQWAINSGYNDNLTIERKDNNGNYEPENCCWVTKAEQQKHKRNNVVITFNGESKNMIDWAREFNIGYKKLHDRIHRYKWSIEKALNTP